MSNEQIIEKIFPTAVGEVYVRITPSTSKRGRYEYFWSLKTGKHTHVSRCSLEREFDTSFPDQEQALQTCIGDLRRYLEHEGDKYKRASSNLDPSKNHEVSL